MAERSRYDRVRRILGLVAVVAAVTLLLREDCKRDTTAATLRLRLGEAAAVVTSLRADVFDLRGASAGFFERAYPSGAPDTVVFPLEVRDEGEYRVEVLVERAAEAGGPVRVTRSFAVSDGASISLELADALAAPRAP
jgi:hypothetical protein